MKIRSGFVSNSSSTSFLIVGVQGYQDARLAQLAVSDKWQEGGQGYHEGQTLVFLGSDYDYDDDKPVGFRPYYAGIDAEEALEAGKTVAELKTEFISRAKVLGIFFKEEEVDLYFGEVSSE